MADNDDVVQALQDLQEAILERFEKSIPGPMGGKYQLALEQTQKNILIAVNKMAGIKATSDTIETKTRDALLKNINVSTNVINRETQVRKAAATQYMASSDIYQSSTSGLAKAFDYVKRTITGLPNAYRKFKADDQYNDSRSRKLKQISEVSTGNLSGVISGFTKALGGATFSTIVTSIIGSITESVSIYRQLNEAGQGFNGSILQMSRTAAEAGMPLEMFAKVVIANSKTMAALGGPQVFGGLYKNVRESISNMGQYGLTLEQGAEYFASYLETERMTGGLRNKSNMQLTGGFVELLDEIDKTSKETGVQRKAILDQVMNIKQSSEVFGLLHSVSGKAAEAMDKSITDLAVEFAGIPGDLGKELTMSIQEGAPLGTVLFGQLGQQLNMFGGGLRAGMDKILKAQTTGGDTKAAERELEQQALGLKNDIGYMKNLTVYANSMHDAAAKKTLDVIQALSVKAEARAKLETQPRTYQEATKALLNFEQAMQGALGAIRAGFLRGLGPFASKLNTWLGEDGANLTKMIEEMGKQLGTFVGEVFNPATLDKMSTAFGDLLGAMTIIGSTLISLGDILLSTVHWVDKFNKAIFGESGGGIATALELGMTYLFSNVILKGIMSLFTTWIMKPLVAGILRIFGTKTAASVATSVAEQIATKGGAAVVAAEGIGIAGATMVAAAAAAVAIIAGGAYGAYNYWAMTPAQRADWDKKHTTARGSQAAQARAANRGRTGPTPVPHGARSPAAPTTPAPINTPQLTIPPNTAPIGAGTQNNDLVGAVTPGAANTDTSMDDMHAELIDKHQEMLDVVKGSNKKLQSINQKTIQ
jgi:hypothetical protein